MATVTLETEVSPKASNVLPMVLHTRVVTGAGGGPEKTILNSPRFLPDLGYRSICAYMRPAGDQGFETLRRRASDWAAPLVELDDRGPLDFGLVRQLVALCREHNVAVWHGHDYKSNLLGLLVRRHWDMKLITTVHGWVKHTWKTPLYYAIDRLCLRWYDRVICVSDDLHEACLKSGIPSHRCTYIENAIDTTQFKRRQSVAEAKKQLGFDPTRKLIGAVGRLSAEKGFDILIQATKKLLDDHLDVDLVIAGDGDQRESLTRLIVSLGLQDRVTLLGYRADTIALFQAFDVMALSSYREGLPNVILEAMALETPVVSTAIAGIPKVITDRHDGLLLKPGDPEGLARSLTEVLTDSRLGDRLAANARGTIEKRFSFHCRMQKIAQVYHEVLNAP